MGRLFWKIFLWFWLAMLLVTLGVAVGVASFMEERGQPLRQQLARQHMETALLRVSDALELSGLKTAQRLQRRIGRRSPLQIRIVPAATAKPLSPPAAATDTHSRLATAPDGRSYRVEAQLHPRGRHRRPPPGPFGLFNPRLLERAPGLFLLKIGLAVLLSGLVCFWLAWYLTRPIGRLQEATRRLAAGDLSARVGPSLGRRRDEIADLGRGFDHMAQQLQALLSAQQRLLHDVSHELRSPLARLQVAVGLARRDSGENGESAPAPALDRIERESGRLDELVGQLLTLSRLEAGARERRDDYPELGALLQEIAADADFEAGASDRRVELTATLSATVRADMELLRRALENVVRNAVKFTAPDTSVEISMAWATAERSRVHISVCDRGPGVEDVFLPQLFEPFSRGETGSTGYGLRPAIARRAIEAHEGSISARNRSEGGLCIDIELPVQS